MHPSATHTIGNTLVKLSSVNGDDWIFAIVEIGVLDDEITVGFIAFDSPNNSSTMKHANRSVGVHIICFYSFLFFRQITIYLKMRMLKQTNKWLSVHMPKQ